MIEKMPNFQQNHALSACSCVCRPHRCKCSCFLPRCSDEYTYTLDLGLQTTYQMTRIEEDSTTKVSNSDANYV